MNSFQKWLPAAFGIIVLALIGAGAMMWLRQEPRPSNESIATTEATSPSPLAVSSPTADASATPLAAAASSQSAPQTQVDLTTDANGMSKATVVLTTTQGTIKLKVYPQDAPSTVNRFVELVQHGFYNGLAFHRAIDGFIIQTGDPTGSGTGGSGQKLKAEFNSRRHLEGAVAMARAPSDPNSADSQFYITLSAQPRLDRNYTVFGQVIDGMDAARKIKVGDKITSAVIQ